MKKWLVRLVAIVAISYPLALAVVVVALRAIGERWWVTATALYLPRAAFALPLPFIVGALVVQRRWRLLATQLLAAALLAFPLMGLVLPHFHRRQDGPSIRVFSLNANGGLAGPDVLLTSIDRYAADVVLLEEIVLGPDDPLFRGLRSRYPTVVTSSQFVVASRFPLSPIDEPDRLDYSGRKRSPRYIRMVVDTPLGSVALYGVHPISPREDFYSIRGHGLRHELLSGRFFQGAAAPVVQANSGLRAAQIESIAERSGRETLPVLIAGDTNLPDLSPLLGTLSAGREDGFRGAGSGLGYTFPASHPWMRIDRMFADAALRFETFEVGCAGASDHLCIVAQLGASSSK